MSTLTWKNVHAVPCIHGRLAFALEVRRQLLEQRFAALCVELPPSLEPFVLEAVQSLPRAHVVLYSEVPRFLQPDAPYLYVPVQPADAIIEALRIARGERLPIHFIDADLMGFVAEETTLPDPHSLHTLGLEGYLDACLPALAIHYAVHPKSVCDRLREGHMAATLARVARATEGEVLFVCGMAHWASIRRLLEGGEGEIHPADPVPTDLVKIIAAHPESLTSLAGEIPAIVERYEKHRSGFELDDFDVVAALKEILLEARELYANYFPGSLETPGPQSLRTVLEYARRMTIRKGFLLPDVYTLTVAANGVVGNDFAITLLEVLNYYRFNGIHRIAQRRPQGQGHDERTGDDQPKEGLRMHRGCGLVDGDEVSLKTRLPGTRFSYGRLQLEKCPDFRVRRQWRGSWDPNRHCSHEPEDLVIENFRDYIGKRALSLARVETSRTVPFTTSILDGIDVRATLRDVVDQRIHVREERQISGGVGSLVVIFEEDDFGVEYPWRTTWYAEHHNESTLSLYATDFMEDLVAPGIGRAYYGGFLMIYPPITIPDIWDDLRFENARTPSERLLLAAIYWSPDHFVVHVGKRPPSDAARDEAKRRGKHILQLPLSTFSSRTLERLRRVHVLNGREVRSYAQKFIR